MAEINKNPAPCVGRVEDDMKEVAINVTEIPRAVRDDLARSLLERVVVYFEQPGVEEDFQAWLKEYKERKAATAVATT